MYLTWCTPPPDININAGARIPFRFSPVVFRVDCALWCLSARDHKHHTHTHLGIRNITVQPSGWHVRGGGERCCVAQCCPFDALSPLLCGVVFWFHQGSGVAPFTVPTINRPSSFPGVWSMWTRTDQDQENRWTHGILC